MRSLRHLIPPLRRSILNVALLLGLIQPLLGAGVHAQSTQSRPPFRYGIVASSSQYYPEVTKLGFGYVKLFVSWNNIESSPGHFGGFPDSAVNTALANNLQIVALIHDTPAWANGTGTYNPNNPPPSADNVAEFGNFAGTLAAHYQGRIAAYEIWNEENVSDTWGGQNPDVGRYVSMLQAAYPKIKLNDPNALVVSGGIANTGDGNGASAIGDLTYLQDMLQGGGLGNIDAVGIHPYPGACAPEATSCAAVPGTYFQRAVEEHNVVASFSSSLPMWITEAGYFSQPGAIDPTASNCNGSNGLGGFTRYEVDETTKANYLVDAYQYAYNNWPWLEMFMMMNLDMDLDTWRAACDPVRFWAILTAPNGRNAPFGESQAFTALMNMPKTIPQLILDLPPTGGYPQDTGSVTISGHVIDPTSNAPLTIDQVNVTVDSVGGTSSPLATSTFDANGHVQVMVDVRSLSAYSTHSVYVSAHTTQDGWLNGSTGVAVVPLIRGSVNSVRFTVDPRNGLLPPAQTINILRNDGNSDAFGWSVLSVDPAASWLTIDAADGFLQVKLAIAGNPPPASYQTTVTIGCTDPACTGNQPYFANKIVLPVSLVFTPQITIDPAPVGGFPETDGTVTLTGKVVDLNLNGPLSITSVSTTIDTPSGPPSPLAETSTNSDGTFKSIVDVRSLSMQDHQIYITVNTLQDGSLTGSTSVQVKRLIDVQTAAVEFDFDPNISGRQIQTIPVGRNDGSKEPITWNATFNPAASWLTVTSSTSGSGADFTVDTTGLAPGFYQTTVTLTPTGSDVFANFVTIPILLVNLNLPFKGLLPLVMK